MSTNKMYFSREGLNEVMKYADEETDPIRLGRDAIACSPSSPREGMVFPDRGMLLGNMIVIGPDLEAEKKAAKKK